MTELERLRHENAQLTRQVTDVQRRCTELLEEKRRACVDYAVREFHLKYGHPAPGRLTVPDEAMIRFRARLITEEYLELIDAMFAAYALPEWETLKRDLRHVTDTASVDVDLVEWADATHDLDYVVAGTRVVFGYDGAPGAAEVHRANMDKVPNGLGKPTKPEGWRPPDIEGVLRAQGWKKGDEPAQWHVIGMDVLEFEPEKDWNAERAPYAPPTDVKLEMPSNEPKICEAEGCDVLHPSACSADPSVDGWLCPKHAWTYENRTKNNERDGTAAGRLMRILDDRPRFFQEAARGLRKLAAKYPEMPADGECGDVSRGYYEMMAETLERLVKS